MIEDCIIHITKEINLCNVLIYYILLTHIIYRTFIVYAMYQLIQDTVAWREVYTKVTGSTGFAKKWCPVR